MEEAVSAADANRKFSQLLRSVREGRTYIVTVHGKPVARIVPIKKDDKVTSAGRAVLFARLRSQPILNVGPWTRNELYDDEK
jgi:prevent-host-death family protein